LMDVASISVGNFYVHFSPEFGLVNPGKWYVLLPFLCFCKNVY
jgi:hypothetical protein